MGRGPRILLKSIPIVECTGQNKVTGTWLLGDLTSVSRSLVGWSLLVCNALLWAGAVQGTPSFDEQLRGWENWMPLGSGFHSTAGPACHSVTFEGLKPFRPALMELEGSSKQWVVQASKAQTGFDLEPVGLVG